MKLQVLGFDPGEVTGWSLFEVPDDAPLRRLDYGLIKGGVDGVIDWCVQHPRYLRSSTVVSEGFIPESNAVEWRTPIRIEGVLLGLCSIYGAAPPIFQSRSTKRAVGDGLLKAHGLWLRGDDVKVGWTDARDVNDSQLHVIARVKHDEHVPTLRALWPEDGPVEAQRR